MSSTLLWAPGPGERVAWFGLFTGVLTWSAIDPHDYPTWWLEVLPALLGVFVLGALWTRFRFTRLVMWLILGHMVVLMIGGHYTYARVPAFDWLAEALDLGRNHYDRLGHLVQGFVPAMIGRELLLRTSPLQRGFWLNLLVICACLAISAFYELIEWWVALLSEEAAESFLGTQGDVWDTQSDMFLALVGAILALLTLSRPHDAQLRPSGA